MTDPRYERIKALFLAASDLDGPARAEYLAQSCADDPTLREEVESLLRTEAPPKMWTGGALDAVGAILLPGQETLGFAPQSMIGSYRLLERIGEGTFGEVWVAEQQSPLRKVALKIIKAGMDTREVLARFEDERQALAVMDHPNIAKIYDAGATESGRPYFVMEYIQGVSIVEYCNSSHLRIQDRLRLFDDVCLAVQHAHQKGVIHRDLKPPNILVVGQGAEATPKIIDFGIAKAVCGRISERTLFTEEGCMIGTPEYMSPEQAKGSNDIDTRTDIYSLGVVLYELLTGTLPLSAEVLREGGFEGLARLVCNQDPPKPSTRLSTIAIKGNRPAVAALEPQGTANESYFRALRREVRGDLDWITMKALEKEKERRYASASELAEDITRHLRHEPVRASPPTIRYRAGKFVRRNRGFIAALGVVLVALTAGVIGTGVAWVRAEQQRDRAVAIKDFLVRTLQTQDPTHTSGKTDILVSDAMQQALRMLDRGELKHEPQVVAELLSTICEILLHMGKAAEAEPVAARALEEFHRIHSGDHLDIVSCLNHLGTSLCRQGRYKDAEERFNEALATCQRLGRGNNLETIKAWRGLGVTLESIGKPSEALPHYEAALAMSHRLTSDDNLDLATCINDVACCLDSLGRSVEALPKYNEALEMCRRLYKDDHPAVAAGMNNVAFCLWALGRTQEALPQFEAALAMRERIWKGDHPDVAEGLVNLANCLFNLTRASDALPYFERGTEMFQRIYGPEHSDLATSRYRMSACLAALGQKEAAVHQCQLAVGIRRKALPPDHLDTAAAELALGSMLVDLNRFEEAEPLLVGAEEKLRDRQDAPAHTKRYSIGGMVKLYDRRDAAEPGKGYAEKAAHWRGILARGQATTHPISRPADGN